MDPFAIAAMLLSAVVAAGAGWLARGRALAGVRRQAGLDVAAARAAAADAQQDAAKLQGMLEASAGHHAAQVAELTALRESVQKEFKLLAGDVLKAESEDFLRRAGETFEAQKKLTAAEIDKRTRTIADTVKPLGEKLQAYEALVREIEKSRIESYGNLTEMVRAGNARQDELKTVTAHLVGALRAAPKVRGRWGEEALRRVAELSGMTEHCDFDTEFAVRGADENRRPDMVIRVSGGRQIIVDAKAPLSAYFSAIEAATEEERDKCLVQHARQLRERMADLADKKYWELFTGTVDCVVMFVPGDNFVSAAFEKDQRLFDDALKSRVLICTPTTFLALIKAISYGWGQEKLAQSAAAIGALGKELYARLSSLGEHVAKLGRTLESSVKSYNGLVGSLETHVLPQARRFNDLGVAGTAVPLPEAAEVDAAVRLPQPGRDLRLPPPDIDSDSN